MNKGATPCCTPCPCTPICHWTVSERCANTVRLSPQLMPWAILLCIALVRRAPEATISLLLNHGANPNQGSSVSGTPLFIAASIEASPAVVVALLEHGAAPDKGDSDEVTKIEAYLRHLSDIHEIEWPIFANNSKGPGKGAAFSKTPRSSWLPW